MHSLFFESSLTCRRRISNTYVTTLQRRHHTTIKNVSPKYQGQCELWGMTGFLSWNNTYNMPGYSVYACVNVMFICNNSYHTLQSEENRNGTVKNKNSAWQWICIIVSSPTSPATTPCMYLNALSTPYAIHKKDIKVDDPEARPNKDNIRPGGDSLKAYKDVLTVSIR